MFLEQKHSYPLKVCPASENWPRCKNFRSFHGTLEAVTEVSNIISVGLLSMGESSKILDLMAYGFFYWLLIIWKVFFGNSLFLNFALFVIPRLKVLMEYFRYFTLRVPKRQKEVQQLQEQFLFSRSFLIAKYWIVSKIFRYLLDCFKCEFEELYIKNILPKDHTKIAETQAFMSLKVCNCTFWNSGIHKHASCCKLSFKETWKGD